MIDLIQIGGNCVDWIDLPKDMDNWVVFMNAVMNFESL
jgi:hypothetical protein